MLPSYVDIHSAYHYPSYVNMLSTTPVIGHVMRGVSTAGQFAADHALPIVAAIAAHQLYTKVPGAYKEWKDAQNAVQVARLGPAPTTTARPSHAEDDEDIGPDIEEVVTRPQPVILNSKNIPPADKKKVDAYHKELVKRIETMGDVDEAIESLRQYIDYANDSRDVLESVRALGKAYRGNLNITGNPYIPEDYIKKSVQRFKSEYPNAIKKIEDYTNQAIRDKEQGFRSLRDPDSLANSGLNAFEYRTYRGSALAVQEALGGSKTSVHHPFTASLYIPKALRGKVKIE